MKYFLEKALNIAFSKNRPTSLIHFITNRCNARCPHCFIDFDDKENQRAEMKLSDIDKMTQTVGRQLMNVNFTGGEPFLAKNIAEIARLYLNHTAIDSMYFSTNGGFPEKTLDIAKSLAEDFPEVIFTYSISIDDIQECHDHYRRSPKLYQKAMQTYWGLVDAASNIQTNISLTVSPHNASRIIEIFEYLYKVEKIRTLTATIVRDEGVFKIQPEKAKETLEGYQNLVRLIQDHKLFYQSTQFLGRMMNTKERRLYEYVEKSYLNPHFQLTCRAGGLLGVIYPNGDVFPCEVLAKKMGNLYDFDLNIERLWSKNGELRNWIKKTQCQCSYECAWSYNILSSPKHMVELGISAISK